MGSKNSGRIKGRFCLWIGCIAAYLLALVLLTWVERGDPNSSIQNLGDAFWYSVVTMSTVGYGDLYPVTLPGRLLGVGFVLLSVGLLTFVIGTIVSVLTGTMLPALRLWLLRGEQWFVFSGMNSSAAALVRDLAAQYPDGVFLFPKDSREQVPGDLQGLLYPGTMEQVVSGKKDRCSLFFMDGNSGEEYEKALEARKWGHPVYCLTEYAPDACPEGMTLFNQYDCCAQEYWRSNGLGKQERNVLLIGDGKYARHLLIRGLLVNEFGPERQVHYHVFGDWQNFRRNHHRLGTALSIDQESEGLDSLFFHSEPWNEDSLLLEQADRIVICHDDEGQNMTVLRHLRRYFPTKAKIDLRSRMPIPGETVFGTDEKMFTAELVMRAQLSRAARAMHRIYCENAGGNPPGWDQLSEFLRQSNIAAADHVLIKIRILLQNDSIHRVTAENCAKAYQQYRLTWAESKEAYRQIEHRRWIRFHSMHNWRYAQTRDNAARLHPLMLPFEDLDLKEQEKDDYAWELLEALSRNLDDTSL